MIRRVVMLCAIAVATSAPALAQDQALDPLLFAPLSSGSEQTTDIEARTLALYRLPLAVNLRRMDEEQWGIRVTFPVSLSSLRINGVSDVGPFARKLGIAAIVPGLELEIPLRDNVRMRPFAEVGFGHGSGKTEALYGVGDRLMIQNDVGVAHLTYGGSAMYRNSYTSGNGYDGHGTFEAGLDTQFPLGLSVGSKAARAGGYFIARKFAGLELVTESQERLTLSHQYEVGASFATTPVFSVWKIRLPWVAVGYHFGRTLSGVRIYTKFPF